MAEPLAGLEVGGEAEIRKLEQRIIVWRRQQEILRLYVPVPAKCRTVMCYVTPARLDVLQSSGTQRPESLLCSLKSKRDGVTTQLKKMSNDDLVSLSFQGLKCFLALSSSSSHERPSVLPNGDRKI